MPLRAPALLLLLMAAALPAAAQAPPTPQDLAVEIRALRTETQSLRRDLKSARSDGEKERQRRAATEENLQGVIAGQEERLHTLKEQTDRLTWLSIGLGVLALLALVAALRRRNDAEVSPDLLIRQSRIAQLKDLIAANDARVGAPAGTPDKEPHASV
jgi:hypothetical protein